MTRVILLGFIAAAICACRPAAREAKHVPPPVAPAVAPQTSLADRLSVVALDLAGTEPAWMLKIRPGALTLDRPGHPEVVTANPGPQMLGDAAAWDAPPSGDGRLLIATLSPGPCVTPGSDRVYPYHAEVEDDGDRLDGCGAPAQTG